MHPNSIVRLTIDDLLEVTLPNAEAFLKVKETLTRIGVASKTEKKLWQSCHILHKRGRYAIVHFKEMFLLDGLQSDISEVDVARRNTIAKLLEEWGLVKIVHPERVDALQAPINLIKIIPHKDKGEWELIEKYHIGKRHNVGRNSESSS